MLRLFSRTLTILGCSLIILVAVSVFAQTSNPMTKRDLADDGFLIVGPNDSSFESELRHLNFDKKPEMSTLKPFSVILRNSSSRSVVAFAIKWVVSDASGKVLTRSFNYIEPSGLLDGGREKTKRALVEHQIRPGGTRLLTTNGMDRTEDELRDLASSPLPESVQHVEIDLAVFDDGESIGPNTLGLMEIFAAYVNARQDVMEEVDSRTAKGENLKSVVADIKSRLTPEADTVQVTPRAIYGRNVRAYLTELETTERNFGEATAKNVVSGYKYTVRPNIHLRPSRQTKAGE